MNFKLTLLNCIFLLSFATMIASCGDDESETVEDNPLVGTWKWMINQRLDCGVDEGSFNVYNCTEFCYEVEFRADGTLTSTVQDDTGTYSGGGTYTKVGNAFTLCIVEPDGSEYCESGEITIAGDKFEFFVPKPTPDVCDVIKHFEKK